MDARSRSGTVVVLTMAAAVALAGCRGTSADPPMGAGSGSELSPLDAQLVDQGKKLYETYCQACHGVEGVGERPGEPAAVDAAGLPVAPALDGSMHDWHHTDEGLVTTILQGSPRNSRMQAWGKTGLAEADARAIVEFMKSHWGPVQVQCQGPGHRDRNCILRARANSG